MVGARVRDKKKHAAVIHVLIRTQGYIRIAFGKQAAGHYHHILYIRIIDYE